MLQFESAVRGSLEGSRGGRIHVHLGDELGDRATPLSGTQLISEPSDQKANRKRRGQAGGRPPAFNTGTYKQRNTVERAFNVFKQWRGLATRYDKLALTYRGGVVLRAITIWLRQ